MNFRRYYYPGQIVFITQLVNDRRPEFNNPRLIQLLRKKFSNVKVLHSFSMLAYVFLPNHFHILVRPTGDWNFSQIMHSLKSNFTRAYKQEMNYTGHVNFWQKRFWDHVIRNEKDLENHIHYIHYNPVKHGYVYDMGEWKYSSFREWQKLGAYPDDFLWREPTDERWGE